MTLDEYFRNFARTISDPLASAFERIGASPNQLSILALFFAVAAAVFYYFSSSRSHLLYSAALMVFLNAVFDMVDGALARRTSTASLRGDFLDHVVDRYSDAFILGGIVFAGYTSWPIGFLAMIGMQLTSYLGTQAQALQIGRYYGGIMGRADRLIAIIIGTIANATYTTPIEGIPILGWLMVVIMLSSHITAIQRLRNIWHKL